MCGEVRYRSSLAALWVESYLFGLYALLFVGYVYIHTNVRAQPNRYFLAVACVMFAVSTAAMVNDLAGFLLKPVSAAQSVCVGHVCNPCPGLTESHFEHNVYYMVQMLGNTLFRTNQFLADMLLSFRCYIVWQSQWRIVAIPVLLVLATAATAYAESYYLTQLYILQAQNAILPVEASLIIIAESDNMGNAATFLSLSSNIILTALIVFRIWRMIREMSSYLPESSRRYKNLMSIIIESGSIYTASLIALLIANYTTSFNNADIISNALNQIVGIVPILIIVRAALNRDVEATMVDSGHILSSQSPPSSGRTYSGRHIELGAVQPRKTIEIGERRPSVVVDVSAREEDIEAGDK